MLRPTWVEVDREAIKDNLHAVRKLVGPNIKIMAVVKANAYGHGIFSVADMLAKNGADHLAVATIDEAIALRESGIKLPILVLGTTIPESGVDEVVESDIALALCTTELATALSTVAQQKEKKARVHLKIDTGMSRIGVLPEKAVAFMNEIKDLPGLKFEGIFSHFAVADELGNPYTLAQFQRFQQAIHALEKAGFTFLLKHIANSAAILSRPETYLDMVRSGCLLYGFWPGNEVQRKITLKPAFALKTRIVYLKEVPVGTPVSYGLTAKTDSSKKLATLPIGYGDGYCRKLSNRADVIVRGIRVPIIGRVCMDQCIVDVTNVPGASLGDEVVMIGSQNGAQVSFSEIAELLDTVPLCCMGSSRVPRIYV